MLATTPVPAVQSAATIVRIKDIAFHPRVLDVDRGSRVTWRFRDEVVTHNVHSVGTKRFRSSKDQKLGTYSVTFKKAGTYRYKCTIHPTVMKARIVVK